MPPIIDWNILRVYLAVYNYGLYDPDEIRALFQSINEILEQHPEELVHCLRTGLNPSFATIATSLERLHFDAASPLALIVEEYLTLRAQNDRLRNKLRCA